jgi:hypothetical protein
MKLTPEALKSLREFRDQIEKVAADVDAERKKSEEEFQSALTRFVKIADGLRKEADDIRRIGPGVDTMRAGLFLNANFSDPTKRTGETVSADWDQLVNITRKMDQTAATLDNIASSLRELRRAEFSATADFTQHIVLFCNQVEGESK